MNKQAMIEEIKLGIYKQAQYSRERYNDRGNRDGQQQDFSQYEEKKPSRPNVGMHMLGGALAGGAVAGGVAATPRIAAGMAVRNKVNNAIQMAATAPDTMKKINDTLGLKDHAKNLAASNSKLKHLGNPIHKVLTSLEDGPLTKDRKINIPGLGEHNIPLSKVDLSKVKVPRSLAAAWGIRAGAKAFKKALLPAALVGGVVGKIRQDKHDTKHGLPGKEE
jgi:hypothetical protein